MKKKIINRIMWGILGLFLVIQVFRIDKTNPPVDPEQDFAMLTTPPPEVNHILKEACYDCHSNITRYPWYSNVAPVSWILKNHVNEGRENLNFSVWGTYLQEDKPKILKECAEVVKEGEMPLKSYTWTHPAARLTVEQRQTFTAWLAQGPNLEAPNDNEAPAVPTPAAEGEEGEEGNE